MNLRGSLQSFLFGCERSCWKERTSEEGPAALTKLSKLKAPAYCLSLPLSAYACFNHGPAMSRPSPIFSGSHVSRRTINLGGATRPEGTSQNDLIKRAKRQREEREEQRVRERAAAKIQVCAFIRVERRSSVFDAGLHSPTEWRS